MKKEQLEVKKMIIKILEMVIESQWLKGKARNCARAQIIDSTVQFVEQCCS